MRSWDSVTQTGSLRPGPAAFAILMAGLLLSLAPVSQRIEATYYDFLQRVQPKPGSAEIVIVDTRTIEDGGSLWDAARFPDLLKALGAAGARVVMPVEAPPVSAALPDSMQLATLAEIERRSREASSAAPTTSARDDAFGRELAAMQRRSDLQARTVQAAAKLRNLIVAVPTFDGARNAVSGPQSCVKHLFQVGGPADSSGAASARRVRAATPPPEQLCAAALSAGHVEFWPDADGVVRRADLLVDASGALVASAALRAALAVDFPTGEGPVVDNAALTWGTHVIRTTGGPGVLLRYYSPAHATREFHTVDGAELLRGAVPRAQLAGRFVILGHAVAANREGQSDNHGDAGYLTPVGERTPVTVVLATALSNLLDEDYLVRPDWLSWSEWLVLVLLGVAVLLWGARLPAAAGIAVGAVVAAALLGTEAFLMLRAGISAQLATAATFIVLCMSIIHFLQPRAARKEAVAVPMAAAGAPVPAAARATAEDELDLAFSMLRHQPPSTHVKQRLYDVALEHARRRDLAKAERVLRHLAGLDPDFRNAGDKLKKLAGMRNATPQPAAAAPAPAAKAVPVRPLPADAESLSGKTIGRYEIEQPIGRGAMATVYLGRDPKINRRVAIKTIALAEEFSDNDLVNARTQFLREAESAGRLNHPNIISIYDAGEDEQIAYLAMEYAPGKSLSFYAQQGNMLEPAVVFELMARAAEALHYAHGQHVVHRDVKPANLLYDKDTDTLKITDFGIARLTDTSRTKTGIILGTPSYMSPEQLQGTNVGGQSDLFSLGITLYQLLTGMPPFRADSIPKLMQKIAHEEHESVRVLRDDLPACVDEILARALAKSPEDRYPNGRAMALALRDCCSSFAASAVVRSATS